MLKLTSVYYTKNSGFPRRPNSKNGDRCPACRHAKKFRVQQTWAEAIYKMSVYMLIQIAFTSILCSCQCRVQEYQLLLSYSVSSGWKTHQLGARLEWYWRGKPKALEEIIIIIIIIRYECLLSQAFSSRYFSWTSSDPLRSRFKLHTAVLSVLCVMFQV